MSSDGDGDDYDSDEPVTKQMKGGDGEPHQQRSSDGEDTSEESVDFNSTLSVEVKKGNMNEALPQVFAQTIVNALFEVKNNPKLENYYIPSFLATATTVSVHMYIVKEIGCLVLKVCQFLMILVKNSILAQLLLFGCH